MTPIDPLDDPLDPTLLDAAREYHRPPQHVPRDAMWAAIARSRASRGPRTGIRPRWASYPALIAASVLLAAGITAGWFAREHLSAPELQTAATTATRVPGVPEGMAGGSTTGTIAYRIAVAHDLTGAEALITAFEDTALHSTGDQQTSDAQLDSWARELLSNTRLLLDSPAGRDPQRRRLLEDLELVLVQIIQVGPSHRADDRQLINRTLDRNQVLTRLRTAIPAGMTGL